MDNSNALATREARLARRHGTVGNMALGAALGSMTGLTLAILSIPQATFDAVGLTNYVVFIDNDLLNALLVGGILAMVAGLVTFFAMSERQQHAVARRKLSRAAELRREELITQQDYDAVKRRLLARYAEVGSQAFAKAVYAAKLAWSAGVLFQMMIVAFYFAEFAWAGPTFIAVALVSALIGMLGALGLTAAAHLVVERITGGNEPDRLPAPG